MIKKILYLFTLSLLIVACNTPAKIDLNDQRFQTPDTIGKPFGGRVEVGTRSQTQVTLFSDFTATPPHSSKTTIEKSDGAGAELGNLGGMFNWITGNFHFGLTDWLDINQVGVVTGIKAQVLGDKNSMGPKASVNVGRGNISRVATEGVYKANSKMTIDDAGLSVGYRNENDVVAYLSFGSRRIYGTTVVSGGSTNFTYDDEGRHQSTSLGVEYQQKTAQFVLTAELTSTLTTWTRAQNFNNISAGLVGGFQW